MYPDGPGVKKMLHVAAERADEMLGAVQREADHVDDDVALQVADFFAEGAGLFFSLAVGDDGPDLRPYRMGLVGLRASRALR